MPMSKYLLVALVVFLAACDANDSASNIEKQAEADYNKAEAKANAPVSPQATKVNCATSKYNEYNSKDARSIKVDVAHTDAEFDDAIDHVHVVVTNSCIIVSPMK
jgi:hypothetical protein